MKKKLISLLLCTALLFTACSAPTTSSDSTSDVSSSASSVTGENNASSAESSQEETSMVETSVPETTTTTKEPVTITTTKEPETTTTTKEPETTTTAKEPETTTEVATTVPVTEAPEPEPVIFPTALQTVNNIKVGWNLGNTLESNGEWIGLYSEGKPENYETAWGNPVTKPELIAAVKEAGFNAVRIPVTWHEHIDESGNIDSEWLARVQQVVDYVIHQDMYCVINVHHDAGGGWIRATPECYEKYHDKISALWRDIAVHFKDYGDKLMFEGFNEMLDADGHWGGAGSPEEYKAHNDFNQLFVDVVRATGGNNAQRNLMVQIYSGACGDGAFENLVLPTDSTEGHLIIQVHNYDPQPFTWTSVDYTEPTDQWGSKREKEDIKKLFSKLSAFSQSHNVPVIVGECGADFKDNEATRKAYVEHFFSCASEYEIKCFWWDTGAMALFDRNTYSEKYPEIIDIIMNACG